VQLTGSINGQQLTIVTGARATDAFLAAFGRALGLTFTSGSFELSGTFSDTAAL
jgi:hypothetical protein